jgi:hypothetical protein
MHFLVMNQPANMDQPANMEYVSCIPASMQAMILNVRLLFGVVPCNRVVFINYTELSSSDPKFESIKHIEKRHILEN